MEADPHCLSKSPRASCEVGQGRLRAAKPHEIDSIQRLKCTQQDPGAHTGNFTADVEHEMQPIGEIYIGMPPIKKQRSISSRSPSEGMPCGIAHHVRLCFHDPAAQPALWQIVYQSFPNQKARQLSGVDG